MAKKKKNRLSNDVRGYATTNSRSAPPLPSSKVTHATMATSRQTAIDPVAKSGWKPPVIAPSSRVQISSDVQQIMESLLRELHSLQEESVGGSPDTPTGATDLPPLTALENMRGGADFDAAKLRRRVGAIYDSLKEYGFHFQQIQDVITACSTNVTLTLALDWLCYNIPTSDLPALFTEGLIRESESKKNNDAIGVTLFPAVRATPLITVARDVSPPIERVSNMLLDETKTPKAVQDDERWSSEQKAMLLAQYEFDSSCESDDESLSPASLDSAVPTNGKSSAAASMLNCKDSDPVENENPDPLVDDMNTPERIDSRNAASSDVRIRLEALQGELNALEDDLRNEANNYMRSKDEIKDMRRKANHLRKEVGIWEAKLRRFTTTDENLLPKKSGNTVEVEEDDEAGLFSIFEEADEYQADLSKENSNNSFSTPAVGLMIPNDSVPVGWTGQTPKGYLEEWCRKEKLSKPTFEKLSLNGCRLHLQRKSGKKTFEESGPQTNYLGVQHYLSMKALYDMTPSLPLYRLFPPFYRDIWIDWINSEKNEKLEQSDSLASIRNDQIDALMECIKISRANFSDDSTVSRVGRSVEHSHTSLHRIPKIKKANADYVKNVPTKYGTLLREEFSSRKESHSYKSMMSVRRELPIHNYRDRILETIQKHPVTILCAETGTYLTRCSLHLFIHL
jgi:hypothetical protein